MLTPSIGDTWSSSALTPRSHGHGRFFFSVCQGHIRKQQIRTVDLSFLQSSPWPLWKGAVVAGDSVLAWATPSDPSKADWHTWQRLCQNVGSGIIGSNIIQIWADFIYPIKSQASVFKHALLQVVGIPLLIGFDSAEWLFSSLELFYQNWRKRKSPHHPLLSS